MQPSSGEGRLQCGNRQTRVGDLEAHIRRFVDHYNHRRYHESLKLPCHPSSQPFTQPPE
jgi:hypothetical protein